LVVDGTSWFPQNGAMIKRSLKSLMVVLCGISVCQIGLAEQKPWIQITSPHFRLITNGSEGSGRHVARQFELIRAVFESQFPGLRLEGNSPLLLVAPRERYITSGVEIAKTIGGMYIRFSGREFAIVRLDVVGSDRIDPDMYATVYHEYVHSLLHANFRVLPSWLDEGMAQFYGFTRFEGDQMYVGAPPKNLRWMDALYSRTTPLLAGFIATRSMYFPRSDEDSRMYYAQAWALTHFLTFGQGMGVGERLKQFVNALQRGVEQKKAFEDTFGPFDSVQTQYDLYIQKLAFTVGVVPAPANLKEKDFSARVLSVAETEAELTALSRALAAGQKAGPGAWVMGRPDSARYAWRNIQKSGLPTLDRTSAPAR
jgi:hypothetical protein